MAKRVDSHRTSRLPWQKLVQLSSGAGRHAPNRVASALALWMVWYSCGGSGCRRCRGLRCCALRRGSGTARLPVPPVRTGRCPAGPADPFHTSDRRGHAAACLARGPGHSHHAVTVFRAAVKLAPRQVPDHGRVQKSGRQTRIGDQRSHASRSGDGSRTSQRNAASSMAWKRALPGRRSEWGDALGLESVTPEFNAQRAGGPAPPVSRHSKGRRQNKRAGLRSLKPLHWCRKWDSNPHAFKGGGF